MPLITKIGLVLLIVLWLFIPPEARAQEDVHPECANIENIFQREICSACYQVGGVYDPSTPQCIGTSGISNSGDESQSNENTPDKLKEFDFCDQIGDPELLQSCEDCGEEGDTIFTAFGCVSTDQDGLSRDLITVLFGVAGGVALLSILAGSFLLTTSQGDTNKIKTAKGLVTSSVSGLLFMIFSIIVLRFIGVDILQIPGLI